MRGRGRHRRRPVGGVGTAQAQKPASVGDGIKTRLGAGSARVSHRKLTLKVRNRGNTIDPVGGSVSISGPGGGRSGGITAVRILPGKLVHLPVASLTGLKRGSYTASITLTQAGRNMVSVTRRFRIR